MIPKVIHFTWFGTDPFPPLVEKCIASWKKHLPDYEIILWNADNFDLNINPWVSQACSVKKYAFAADFARVYLLYNYGGIYLDSDIFLLQSLNPLLDNKAFTSFEPPSLSTTALEGEIIGAEPHHPFFKKMVSYYEGKDFVLGEGKYDTRTFPDILYENLLSEGLSPENVEQDVADVHVYPAGYFLWACHDVVSCADNPNAYSIHYARYSWRNMDGIFIRLLVPILDYYREHEYNIWKILKYLHLNGIMNGIYNFTRKCIMKLTAKNEEKSRGNRDS